MWRQRALGVILVFAWMTDDVPGQIYFAEGGAAPTTNVVIQHTAGGFNNFAEPWHRDPGGSPSAPRRDLGQTFLVTGSAPLSVGAITVWARDVGSAVPNSGFTLEIWSFSNAADAEGDTLVTSQAGVFPGGLTTGNGVNRYWTFDIADVLLSTGQHYGYMLSFDAEAANRSVNLVEEFAGSFANGSQINRNNDGNWGVVSGDQEFYIVAVPEPSTIVLTGVAVAFTGFGWWRRRRGDQLREAVLDPIGE